MRTKETFLERGATRAVLAIICVALYIALNLFFGFIFYHALPENPSLLARMLWIFATVVFASLIIAYFYEAVCSILTIVDMFREKNKTPANE